MNLKERKRQMRREIKARVARLDGAYCRKADRSIFKHIIGLPEYRQAQRIFCFVGTQAEIDTAPIIEDALSKGKIVGVPRCVDKGIMNVCRIESLKGLEMGQYGILEPGEEAAILLPEEIDFAVVPCLSCSSTGKRLGYGGGYYDRYLAGTGAFKAVICRAQIMEEDIPWESHDVVMNAVVSECGVLRIR
ncbi:MAG: 5-formyltetrahydrofolate cyclo-ligase [Clostridium sp.]|nr:5-formyltetrahydrofolate cyclo-ligase [Clostridium sp.]